MRNVYKKIEEKSSLWVRTFFLEPRRSVTLGNIVAWIGPVRLGNIWKLGLVRFPNTNSHQSHEYKITFSLFFLLRFWWYFFAYDSENSKDKKFLAEFIISNTFPIIAHLFEFWPLMEKTGKGRLPASLEYFLINNKPFSHDPKRLG